MVCKSVQDRAVCLWWWWCWCQLSSAWEGWKVRCMVRPVRHSERDSGYTRDQKGSYELESWWDNRRPNPRTKPLWSYLLATRDPLNCDVVSFIIICMSRLTPFAVDPEINGPNPECLLSFSDTDTIVLGNNIQWVTSCKHTSGHPPANTMHPNIANIDIL